MKARLTLLVEQAFTSAMPGAGLMTAKLAAIDEALLLRYALRDLLSISDLDRRADDPYAAATPVERSTSLRRHAMIRKVDTLGTFQIESSMEARPISVGANSVRSKPCSCRKARGRATFTSPT